MGDCELVATGQMARLAGLDVDVFGDSIFNCPTLAEACRAAALDLVMRGPLVYLRSVRIKSARVK